MINNNVTDNPDRITEDHKKVLCASRKTEPGKRKFYSNVGEWIETDAWLNVGDCQ